MQTGRPAQQPEPPAIRIASLADLSYVLDLQKRFSDQLGFLPAAALRWYLDAGRVSLVEDNGQPAGYLLGRASLRCLRGVRPVTQTAVQMDAQRGSLGRSLIEREAAAAAAAGVHVLQAWCRTDLPANAFWRACGFHPIGIRRPDTRRGHPLLLWRRALDATGRATLLHMPPLAGHRAATNGTGRLLSPADRAEFFADPADVAAATGRVLAWST